MENQFMPYELALKLKELGFDENECLYFYDIRYKDSDIDSKDEWNRNKNWDYSLGAPLWQQAFDWFREKHDLQYRILSKNNFGRILYYIDCFGTDEITSVLYNKSYPNYDKARQACLEKLIEIVEQKNQLK